MSLKISETENHVRIISLNRPEKRNALNWKLIEDLIGELRSFLGDSTTRCIIITAEGKDFCAGGDISEMVDRFGKALDTKNRLEIGLNEIVRLIRKIRCPVIASVHGSCIGAGLVIATACDVIYASDDAKFGFSYGNIGLVPESSYFLSRLLGLQKAKELVFSRSIISAEQALNYKLITGMFPLGLLQTEVASIAQSWSKGPKDAIRLSKELLNRAFESTLEEQLGFESLAQGTAFTTNDHKEGVNAFLEKRSPKFDSIE